MRITDNKDGKLVIDGTNTVMFTKNDTGIFTSTKHDLEVLDFHVVRYKYNTEGVERFMGVLGYNKFQIKLVKTLLWFFGKKELKVYERKN